MNGRIHIHPNIKKAGNAFTVLLIVCKRPLFWNFPANHSFSIEKATNFFPGTAWFYNSSMQIILLEALTDRNGNSASQPTSVKRRS